MSEVITLTDEQQFFIDSALAGKNIVFESEACVISDLQQKVV